MMYRFLVIFIIVGGFLVNIGDAFGQDNKEGYMLVNESFDELEVYLPSESIIKLKSIRNQHYQSEQDFLSALRATIGNQQTNHHRTILLEAGRQGKMISAAKNEGGYRLIEYSFENLVKDGVPPEVVAKLKVLEGQVYETRQELTRVLRETLDKNEINEYESLIIEHARAGKLVWYTSSPRPASWRMLYEFEEKYPFMRTELYRDGSQSVKKKFMEEVETGDVNVDILHTAEFSMFLDFKKSGQLMYYLSPEYERFPDSEKDPGYWCSLRTISICIAYPAEKIATEEAPRQWLDLIEQGDRWKNKIAIGDISKAGTAYAQYYYLRNLYDTDEFEKKYGTRNFWEKIAELNPLVLRSAQGRIDMLIEGQILLDATSLGYNVWDQTIKKGEGLRGVWPSDGVPMQPCPVAITSQSKHPNCAKLFIDHMLSLEGQTLFQALVGAYSARDFVPSLDGKIPYSEIPQSNRLKKIDREDYSLKYESYISEFNDIFGYFILTDDAFRNLKKEGVSTKVLNKLDGIKDKKYETESEFIHVLETLIGIDQTSIYQTTLLKHARKLDNTPLDD